MKSHPHISARYLSRVFTLNKALLLLVIAVTQAAAADTTPPTTPLNLVTTAIKPASVSLSWSAASDDVAVANYQVYRDGVAIGTTGGITYTSSNLTQATNYSFQIAARDAAGNRSPLSAAVSATTLIRLVEFSSSALSAPESSGTASAGLRLNGSAPTSNTATVSVSGTSSDGDDFSIASTTVTFAANSTTATLPVSIFDDALAEGAETIILTLVSGSQSQLGSRTVCTLTIPANDDADAPSAPTGLVASSITSSSAALKWNASTDNVAVTSYDILRNGVSIRTQSGTTYTNTGLSHSTAYSYTVVAVDPSGNRSPASATLSVNTPARLVNFSSSSLTRDENAGTVQVSLKLNGAAPNAVSAVISVGGSANGSDFAIANTTVTFPVGSTSAALPVSITDDLAPEGSETIKLTLASITGAGTDAGTPAVCTLTIRPSDDTDPPGAPTGLIASGVGPTVATLRWTASVDNVAISSYDLLRDGVSIRKGTGTSYINTGLTPSTTYLYTVVAIDPSGNRSPASEPLAVTSSSRTVEFVAVVPEADDTSTVVELETEEDSTTVLIELKMNAVSAMAVTVNFAVSGTAANGSDYILDTNSATFAPGSVSATIPITIIDDDIPEGFEKVILHLATADGAQVGNIDACKLTILNNDGAPEGVINDLSFFAIHYHRDFYRSPQAITFGWSVVSTFPGSVTNVEWVIRRLDGPARSLARTIPIVRYGEDLEDGHNTMQSWTEDILDTQHTYSITLDPYNKFAESDETNNTYIFIIDVPAPTPGYATISPDLEFFTNSPHFHGSEDGAMHEFMFKVRNTGKTAITGAKWKLSSVSLGFSRERDLGTINPGAIIQYGYELPITQEGEHDFTLSIDSTNAVTNERETNNSIDFVILVSPAQGG